jgi:hypothetical protein
VLILDENFKVWHTVGLFTAQSRDQPGKVALTSKWFNCRHVPSLN